MKAWAVKNVETGELDQSTQLDALEDHARARAAWLDKYENSPGRYRAVPVEITELPATTKGGD